ncbi:MAG TPA: lysylphosphatidylglycerol synthase domain-containing protein [Mycobacteriales bacterium]|nr:lysylphosphatidylglycerol synthase domain-containing protein [Mycobacteriales bacterium]
MPADRTSPETPPATGRWRVVRRVGAVVLRVAPVLGIVIAVGTWSHLPHMHLQPALVGLACWTVGNYLFCPLRWRSVSTRGKKWTWYARVYAEGELLGMLTPQHAGADLWRVRQLLHEGAEKSSAVVEVASDRLSGGLVVAVLAVLAGMTIPPALLPFAGAAIGAIALTAYLVRRLWLPRVRTVARPKGWAFVRAALISGLYQAGYLGFTIGLVAAVGHHVDPLGVASVLGLSQMAGLLPGIHGAGPREGTMTGGLVALGLPLSAAVAAVALGAALTWLPALVVGGSGLAARGWRGVRFTR